MADASTQIETAEDNFGEKYTDANEGTFSQRISHFVEKETNSD